MSNSVYDRESFKEFNGDSSKSYLEIDTKSSTITWINNCLSDKCTTDGQNIQNVSVYGLIDESFRSRLAIMLSNKDKSGLPKKTLWPVPCVPNKLAWWMVEIELVDSDYLLCGCSPILLTDRIDIGYKFAALSADNTYLASSALVQLETIKEDVKNLRQSFFDEIKVTRDDISDAISASKKAEEAAVENKSLIEDLKTQVIHQFNVHTREITKLMTSDVIHDSRMEIFENHVKKTTSAAMLQIMDQADRSGRGLTKKMVVPVGFMAGIIAFLQWLLTKYFHN